MCSGDTALADHHRGGVPGVSQGVGEHARGRRVPIVRPRIQDACGVAGHGLWRVLMDQLVHQHRHALGDEVSVFHARGQGVVVGRQAQGGQCGGLIEVRQAMAARMLVSQLDRFFKVTGERPPVQACGRIKDRLAAQEHVEKLQAGNAA